MHTTKASVNKKIDNFVKGGLENVTEILSTLWEIVNKPGNVRPPLNISPNVSHFWFYLLPRIIRERSLRLIRSWKTYTSTAGPQ